MRVNRNKDTNGVSQLLLPALTGLPRWFSGKEHTCQCGKHRFYHCVGKIPWRRKLQPTLVFLPGKSRGQRSLVDYRPGIAKSWTQVGMHTAAWTIRDGNLQKIDEAQLKFAPMGKEGNSFLMMSVFIITDEDGYQLK